MKQINQLTPEQVALMDTIKNDWLSAIFVDRPKMDKEKVQGLVEWLYTFSGLKKPQVLFVDSPMAAQYACNMVENQVENQVWNQVENQVRNQVWNQVENQVWNQVENQVRNQVWNQVENQVWNQVENQVRNQVWNQVRNQVENQVENQVWNQVWNQVRNQELTFYSFAAYGSVSDFGWLSFYDFFNSVGVEYQSQEPFDKFKNLVRSGIYDMVQLDGLCVVCPLPEVISREGERLHSEEDFAIKWADGYGQHYLYGVHFDGKLWKRVVSNKMTFKEIIAMENIEQRMIALKMYDAEKMLENTKAELVDGKTKRGNELYVVKGVFSRPAYFLKYSCPSTNRVYVSGVDPEVGARKDADLAMGWKHFMTKDEYMKLEVEA